jgi:ABC-type multidrug transport system fused ATPase/permease subunit
MAFKELKYNISEIDDHFNSYVEESVEYAKLKSFKLSMVVVTYFAKLFIIGIVGLLALLLLSLAASLALGTIVDNTMYGFVIMGLVYVLLGIVLYIFRDKVHKPILRMFSKNFFDSP